MPDTNEPKIEAWINHLSKTVGKVDQETYFIGHSIGCQTILRFLEELPANRKVSKVIMVAPWLKLTNLSGDEAWEIAKPWLETPIDFEKVKTKAKEFICIYSDNDKWVPLFENKKFFEEKLQAQSVVEQGKGHFTDSDEIKELPLLLKFF